MKKKKGNAICGGYIENTQLANRKVVSPNITGDKFTIIDTIGRLCRAR
jgi:hypothetical protein